MGKWTGSREKSGEKIRIDRVREKNGEKLWEIRLVLGRKWGNMYWANTTKGQKREKGRK